MPRPKPSEPWVNIALRLTPAQAERVRARAKNRGLSVTDAIREIIDQSTGSGLPTPERQAEIKAHVAAKQSEPIGRPKAKPGSLLKKR
jgi:hypothetical protein